jgi:hypothetical protein
MRVMESFGKIIYPVVSTSEHKPGMHIPYFPTIIASVRVLQGQEYKSRDRQGKSEVKPDGKNLLNP